MDCLLCEGDARRAGTDCPMCGGSGYAPPIKPPDAHCDNCQRGLWFGMRGPKWFENTATRFRVCHWCLERKKTRFRPLKITSAPDALN